MRDFKVVNRLDKKGGYGKFARAGSFWRWEFTWADSGRKGNGYSKGWLSQPADSMKTLERRFMKGVLMNCTQDGRPYPSAARGFTVSLVMPKRVNDMDVFMYDARHGFTFCPGAEERLNPGDAAWLKELFAKYEKEIMDNIRGLQPQPAQPMPAAKAPGGSPQKEAEKPAPKGDPMLWLHKWASQALAASGRPEAAKWLAKARPVKDGPNKKVAFGCNSPALANALRKALKDDPGAMAAFRARFPGYGLDINE